MGYVDLWLVCYYSITWKTDQSQGNWYTAKSLNTANTNDSLHHPSTSLKHYISNYYIHLVLKNSKRSVLDRSFSDVNYKGVDLSPFSGLRQLSDSSS